MDRASLAAEGARVLARAAAAGRVDAPDPLREAWRLLEAVTGIPLGRLQADPRRPAERDEQVRFRAALLRRARGEPLAWIAGRAAFHAIEVECGPGVLVPRPESELLVERLLACLSSAPARILDLGTGSGCLLLALLHARPAWQGLGVDRSPAALQRARRSARALGLLGRARFFQGDWAEALAEGAFDGAVANPPYVVPGEPLGPGVAEWEPDEALFTPPRDPLAPYRSVAAGARRALRPGGWLVVETAAGRGTAVAEVLGARGFRGLRVHRDLAGHERAVEGRCP